jgi:hypothetical protein
VPQSDGEAAAVNSTPLLLDLLRADAGVSPHLKSKLQQVSNSMYTEISF